MKILGKILATISLLSLLPTVALAYSDFSFVGASVKISVCGDSIVEGEENCEKTLNLVFDCKDFGYLPDPIFCDNSCAFDILSCKPIKPPVPVDNTPQDNTPDTPEDVQPRLPALMIIWDINNDDKLDLEEFTSFIMNWVNSWRDFIKLSPEDAGKTPIAGKCDINSDKLCDVTDFSIILYHLKNE